MRTGMRIDMCIDMQACAEMLVPTFMHVPRTAGKLLLRRFEVCTYTTCSPQSPCQRIRIRKARTFTVQRNSKKNLKNLHLESSEIPSEAHRMQDRTTGYRHRRRHVHCTGMDVLVLEMTASERLSF